MEIIFGREEKTSQLQAKVNGMAFTFGDNGSVPKTVSRQHCKITTLDDGSFMLQNLKVDNDTFVNGMGIQTKQVTPQDVIELGGSHYKLRWDYIQGVLSKTVNVAHLEKIWNDYQDKRLQQQIAERKFNTLKSATGLITMLAIAMHMILGSNTMYIILYAIAILLSVGFTIKAYISASKLPNEMKGLTEKFQKDYSCPKCHHFLGTQSYELLKQNKACPYCKVHFDFG